MRVKNKVALLSMAIISASCHAGRVEDETNASMHDSSSGHDSINEFVVLKLRSIDHMYVRVSGWDTSLYVSRSVDLGTFGPTISIDSTATRRVDGMRITGHVHDIFRKGAIVGRQVHIARVNEDRSFSMIHPALPLSSNGSFVASVQNENDISIMLVDTAGEGVVFRFRP